MVRTCALIAPVQPILHRVSCSNETLPNAPKQYETHQHMSLWSNAVDWVHSLRKVWCDFVARTSTLIAPVQPVLHRVSCSNETLPNAPKYYETHQNMSLGSQWGGSSVFVAKNFWCDFMAKTFALIAPVQPVLHQVYWHNETIPNEPQHCEMRQNRSLESYGLDRVRSLWKNPDTTLWQELLH